MTIIFNGDSLIDHFREIWNDSWFNSGTLFYNECDVNSEQQHDCNSFECLKWEKTAKKINLKFHQKLRQNFVCKCTYV